MKIVISEHQYNRLLSEDIEFLLDKESDEYGQIENDYGIRDYNKVHSDIVKFANEAITTFKDKVLLFDSIKIIFVNNIRGSVLGRFRKGTSTSAPIILLSEKNIIAGSKKYDVPLWVVVETTIFHELGHAICEIENDVFGSNILQYDDEEEWVEDFAYGLHTYNEIPTDLEEFINEYNK
jgi:hypothetical protein